MTSPGHFGFLSSMLVVPFRAPTVLLPGWRWTGRLMRSRSIIALPRLGETNASSEDAARVAALLETTGATSPGRASSPSTSASAAERSAMAESGASTRS